MRRIRKKEKEYKMNATKEEGEKLMEAPAVQVETAVAVTSPEEHVIVPDNIEFALG